MRVRSLASACRSTPAWVFGRVVVHLLAWLNAWKTHLWTRVSGRMDRLALSIPPPKLLLISGKMALPSVTPHDIDEAYARMRSDGPGNLNGRPYSGTTLQKTHAFLSMLFNKAIDYDYVSKKPLGESRATEARYTQEGGIDLRTDAIALLDNHGLPSWFKAGRSTPLPLLWTKVVRDAGIVLDGLQKRHD